jgi:hypothetical protein
MSFNVSGSLTQPWDEDFDAKLAACEASGAIPPPLIADVL